ncbi:uncharacterized protein TRUGW13939_06247 [Talaromyces rugulosus]|uniref:Uncharacterized protein n=1 Tax=Talaromyces rugulosus TaxID=121627 RepID=A0A7H8QZE2_TALRU|nr:uncharacterized protein TRUGW13939_06247 [Talaromyces rugulosus]QKX59116.1 hypothetical protein TRUGW13939_06247 [Talaromyces rugulosus]
MNKSVNSSVAWFAGLTMNGNKPGDDVRDQDPFSCHGPVVIMKQPSREARIITGPSSIFAKSTIDLGLRRAGWDGPPVTARGGPNQASAGGTSLARWSMLSVFCSESIDEYNDQPL